jgi:hypothetical protein
VPPGERPPIGPPDPDHDPADVDDREVPLDDPDLPEVPVADDDDEPDLEPPA